MEGRVKILETYPNLKKLPVLSSVMPIGNVTKYLQKLGMGVYDNENQPGVSKKKNLNLGKPCFSIYRLEVKYAVGKQILVQKKVT